MVFSVTYFKVFFASSAFAVEYVEEKDIPVSIRCSNGTIRVNSTDQTIVDSSKSVGEDWYGTGEFRCETLHINVSDVDLSRIPDNDSLGIIFGQRFSGFLGEIDQTLTDKIIPEANRVNEQENALIACKKDLEIRDGENQDQFDKITTLKETNTDKEEDLNDWKTTAWISMAFCALLVTFILTNGFQFLRQAKGKFT